MASHAALASTRIPTNTSFPSKASHSFPTQCTSKRLEVNDFSGLRSTSCVTYASNARESSFFDTVAAQLTPKILNQLNMYPFPLQNVTFTAFTFRATRDKLQLQAFMAKSKEDIKYGTAQARLSEDEAVRVAYVNGTPLEGGKISDSQPVDMYANARNIAKSDTPAAKNNNNNNESQMQKRDTPEAGSAEFTRGS